MVKHFILVTWFKLETTPMKILIYKLVLTTSSNYNKGGSYPCKYPQLTGYRATGSNVYIVRILDLMYVNLIFFNLNSKTYCKPCKVFDFLFNLINCTRNNLQSSMLIKT